MEETELLLEKFYFLILNWNRFSNYIRFGQLVQKIRVPIEANRANIKPMSFIFQSKIQFRRQNR